MQTIQNSKLQVNIRSIGAEICSIRSVESGKEFMWNGDPSIWGSFAPVLFPIIGSLKEGVFLFKEKEYSIPKHGFIRNNKNLRLNMVSEQCVEYSLKYDEVSLQYYPFKFEFLIRFSLSGNSILVEHEVFNHDADESMYFSLGGHPAFKCPINESEAYEDYYLEFEKNETVNKWEVLSNGLIGKDSKQLLDKSNKLPLKTNLFEQDALIIKTHQSRKVSLRSKLSKESVTVHYSDFPYLGIWAKPGGKFVCIEPWLGISDAWDTDQNFETKEGIIKLDPRSKYNAAYTIVIEE